MTEYAFPSKCVSTEATEIGKEVCTSEDEVVLSQKLGDNLTVDYEKER
jgi:hypothetical protein